MYHSLRDKMRSLLHNLKKISLDSTGVGVSRTQFTFVAPTSLEIRP